MALSRAEDSFVPAKSPILRPALMAPIKLPTAAERVEVATRVPLLKLPLKLLLLRLPVSWLYSHYNISSKLAGIEYYGPGQTEISAGIFLMW